MDPRTEFILTQKLELWRTIADATMLWWVSAVVLCVTIIGVAWTHGDKVHNRAHLHIAGASVAAFFTMIFTYGLLVILYTPRLHADIVSLLGMPPAAPTPFDAELWFFRYAMYTGASNYALFILVWILMWRHFAVQRPRQTLQPTRDVV